MHHSRFFTSARILAFVLFLASQFITKAETLPPDLEYFPSRVHAAVFRNWDIVPHDRLAEVLSTDKQTIQRLGKEMGLSIPKPLSAEEVRRNVEMVLRRNWAVFPRQQIEQLLGYRPEELNEFIGKEAFLPALLSSQPVGLETVKYKASDAQTKARAQWFAENVQRHLREVKATPEEPRLAYIQELSSAHKPGDYVAGTKPQKGEADLRRGWTISIPNGAGEIIKSAAEDFSLYCREIQRCSAMKTGSSVANKKVIQLSTGPIDHKSAEAYLLNISEDNISITAKSELGVARALVELERRMGERGGPFLKPVSETKAPTFSPRYVYSYFSLLTDVLGQDIVEAHPDGYLNELFHQDADGIWVYTLLEDLVPSPVFPEINKPTSAARLARLRDLVNRAAKRGLKVYIYLNEPRAQLPSFFEKHPDVKGQPEGNYAALCTSTEAVQKHLRSSFEKVFREVPGLGGVFVITASENLSNCYSHHYRNQVTCPRCSKRSSADVIAEAIRCMSEGVWAADPKAKFIVWDWSWHSVLGEEVPEKIISQLPKGVGLMADFERGTQIVRGGIPMNVEEYSISVVGPTPRAKIRSAQAKQFGYDYLAKIQLSTTWECGTVPFIPVPNLLWKKAEALESVDTSGVMATWTIGSYPSPNTEAFAVRNWNSKLSEADGLHRIAARRYGESAADDAVRGWTKMSAAFSEEFPFSVSPYAGPLQHGPCLPWYPSDIPGGYGRTTLFNCKDDWRHWTAPYPQDVMMKLLRHLCVRWDEGLEDLRKAAAKAPPERRPLAERDLGVAWMVGYYYRTYANALEFYGARDGGDIPKMKEHAAADLKETTEAFRLVRADSRLGWEAELQYFYRPQDVLEKLVSQDAIISPMI
ncbi:MAG: hypothetical protein JWM68_4863 [Verrucomicrobiales bacterium]|nr:hypothetical protein [Verrucomicrobiales bacterium]